MPPAIGAAAGVAESGVPQKMQKALSGGLA